MQSMSFASTARKVTAFAAAAATLLALGACGNSNNGSAGNNGAKSTSEPQEGVPTNYTGSFPMPDPGKAYNNPKDRGELKQGGTLTLPITEIGPNWNAIDVNGNTVYMDGLWHFYMPRIWEYPADGSMENIKPNANYVTKVEQTSDSPETVVFTINDKPPGTTAPRSPGRTSSPPGRSRAARATSSPRPSPLVTTRSRASPRATPTSRPS